MTARRSSATDLELFLFGGARVDLSAARRALQVARWAYRQAEATSAQLWVSLKYTVRWNALAR